MFQATDSRCPEPQHHGGKGARQRRAAPAPPAAAPAAGAPEAAGHGRTRRRLRRQRRHPAEHHRQRRLLHHKLQRHLPGDHADALRAGGGHPGGGACRGLSRAHQVHLRQAGGRGRGNVGHTDAGQQTNHPTGKCVKSMYPFRCPAELC